MRSYRRLIRLVPFLLLLILTVACRQRGAPATPTAEPATPTAVVETTVVEPTADDTPTPLSPTPAPEPALVYDWPPQVIYSSPSRGEETALNGAITVRFDQPMDQASVENAFEVANSATGTRADGTFTWTRPDTVVFTPLANYERKTTYRVNIGNAARSAAGEPLTAPAELAFTTAGNLDVAQVIPADGTDGVATDGAITVLFNRPVVPLTPTGQQSGLPQPLNFEPAVAGSGSWVSTSIYRFEPIIALAGATTYRVTVDQSLADVTGGNLPAAFEWTFTTAPPQVVETLPREIGVQLAPTDPITVVFNMPMDRAATEAAVTVAPAVPLDVAWSADDTHLTLTAADGWALGTRYTVDVAAGAPAATGAAALADNYSRAFDAVPFPAIQRVSPTEPFDTTSYYFFSNIQVGFVGPMDPDTLEGALTITPAPSEPPRYRIDSDGRFLNAAANLARNVRYTVTVSADVADPYGNTLGEPYTWSFTTPDYAPIASINSSFPVGQLSTAFPTTIDILHRNVDQFTVRLHPFDGAEPRLLADPYRVQYDDSISLPSPSRTWTVDVTPDGATETVHRQPLADGGALSTGLYFVSLDAPQTPESAQWWQNQRQLILVADLNVVVRRNFERATAWVTDLATGQPVANVSVSFADDDGRLLGTTTTDAQGLATVDAPIEDYLRTTVAVAGGPGGRFGAASSQWSMSVEPYQLGVPFGYQPEAPLEGYLITDRPIYRPGDTVYFRGIVRQAAYGRYATPTLARASLTLTCNFGDEVATLAADVDARGNFNGEIALPETAPLGTCFLNSTLDRLGSFATVDLTIAEYRAPEFLVAVTPERAEALRGETVDVTIAAEYLFGAPAGDLTVDYTIYAAETGPPWDGPFYSFRDDSAPFNYDPFGGGDGAFGEYVASGTGRTTADGTLTVSLTPDLLRAVDAGSRKVTVEARVVDVTGLSVAGNGAVTLHGAGTYVGVRPESYIYGANDTAAVSLVTVDWAAEPVGDQSVEVVFYSREWESRRVRNDFGQLETRYEPIDTEVGRASVTTDARGEGRATFEPSRGGSYVALATVTDDDGRTHTSSAFFYVATDSLVSWRFNARDRKMDLIADKNNYQVGDTAEVLIQSPFAGPVEAWLAIERGDILEERVITLTDNSTVLTLPIEPTYAPNVYVSVVAVKPVDDSARPFADIRLGVVELTVDPGRLLLDIDVTPDETVLEPGDTVTYEIQATDYSGAPVSADISLALVDLAVLSLRDDNVTPIADHFYRRQPYRSQIGGGLFVSLEGLSAEFPEEAPGLGGGGGGFAEAAVARLDVDDAGDDVRRDFRDTAYWEAVVTTDDDGRATVTVPLPDNLTTWRLTARGASADTLVGQTTTDIRVRRPVLLRPITPRFLTVGDVAEIGTVVNNNTDTALDATVTLASNVLAPAPAQTISVPARGSATVRWSINVPTVEAVDLVFRVTAGEYRDATTPTFGVGDSNDIPVARYTGRDIVGTSGALDDAGRRVEAVLLPQGVLADGAVRWQFDATLAGAVFTSAEIFEAEAYDGQCAHLVAYRLLANAALAKALAELPVDRGDLMAEAAEYVPLQIDQIAARQLASGGWGYCYADRVDDVLTASILISLAQAEAAGFDVDRTVVARAANYLSRRLDNRTLDTRSRANRDALLIYALSRSGSDVADAALTLFDDERALLDPYAEALLLLTLAQATDTAAQQRTLLSDLNGAAIVSAAGAHWEDETLDYANLSSDIRGTAMVLLALLQTDADNPAVDGAVRWLMVAREAQRWPTAQDTGWTLLALTQAMIASGELDAAYTFTLTQSGAGVLLDEAFTPATVLQSRTAAVPLEALAPDEVNFFAVDRTAGDGVLYYTTYLDAALPASALPPINRGIIVERAYYDAACDTAAEACAPLTTATVGRPVRVEVTLIAPTDLTFVVLEDPIPAGAVAIDPALNTSSAAATAAVVPQAGARGYYGWWIFNNIAFRDDRVVFSADSLPAGTYQYTYVIEPSIPGRYQVMPSFARETFFPDVFGRGAGFLLTIEP